MAEDLPLPKGRPEIPEPFARRILEAAITQERSAELLLALFDGGSATVTNSGQLIIISGAVLDSLQPDP